MGDKVFKWYVAESMESELFHSVHDTREEALAEGYGVFSDDPFVLIEADKTVVKPTFNSDWVVETIITELEENNPECWSDDGAEDAWGTTANLRDAIEKAVADWLEDDPPRTFCIDECRSIEGLNGAKAA
ncbi:hypothetical protein [Shinella sp.]|uniref:hypothetical protein n=1 Tax=Shinella sp. TaxID=1870904 RepID=UPI0028AC2CA9|nr:hypothetical protein [Shinella sp.]